MNLPWRKIESELAHTNPWFKVRKDRVIKPDGSEGDYFVVEIKEVVIIIALNKTGEFLLIREYRYPHQKWMWEVPIGSVEVGESALGAAKHELQEETGFSAGAFQEVAVLDGLKGISNQKVHVFIAKDLTDTGSNMQNEEGIDGQRFISFSQFEKEVKQGKITDSETIYAVATAKLFV